MDERLSYLVRRIGEIASVSGLTIGTAESCTGGGVSATISAHAGVSAWFEGSVVSYARSVKTNILGVPKSFVLTHGEVSRPTALAMAQGARRVLDCDWTVAITGIAGPGGGTKDKPVGTVVFAVSGPGHNETSWQAFAGDRQTVQRASVQFALEFLLSALTC